MRARASDRALFVTSDRALGPACGARMRDRCLVGMMAPRHDEAEAT
ncbi:hypothetical protein BJ986_000571 [Phycicoccus badiiscoriae]|uniref:Uncharacterized protein n=1 Tax=Pedococcus badiiscoriae TaxID=642776 RepID=A0A852WHF3_9MICO|nr:hypothetical protein [Pedococcus badiiscoriae]